ncbi:MAG: hypothetical protein JSS67_08535 [Bacteroidetes bacterium]|nr:hypothetical protein [Bacteroidota bacterium]
MKLICSIFLVVFFHSASNSQFYFNDILTTKQTNDQYTLLRKNNIRNVSAKSFEADETQSPDFKLEQLISKDGQMIITNSSSSNTGTTVSTAYYENDRLIKTMDSSENILSVTLYQYDNNGHVESISTTTSDNFMNSHSQENHKWIYEKDLPVKMLLIKNEKDTTTVEFQTDKGEIVSETWEKRGIPFEKYFYYYTSSAMISDIVRYNSKAKQMLPDFTFDYDTQNRVSTFTQIRSSASDYYTWVYEYLPNGLKDKETCFDKQKSLVGKIIFYYQTF